jgi:hypothetical protein
MKKSGIAVMMACAVALLMVVTTKAREDDAKDNLLKLKAGDCTFTLLNSDGVKPLAGSTLSVIASEDGKALITIKADKDGKCPVKLVIGRYVLNVDERNLAVIDAIEDSKITECRIVVPETSVPVGGQDDADADTRILGLKPLLIGGVAVLAGGGYLIYNNNKDDGNPPPPQSP